MTRILGSGVAGFAGMRVSSRPLARGESAAGNDNFPPYFYPVLKPNRLSGLGAPLAISFRQLDLGD
ncbi:MAG: hypothetical protein H0T49_01400 [Chloroflexia bacterium]|nr:hypothetical protein [Chloroflexia bacterium]